MGLRVRRDVWRDALISMGVLVFVLITLMSVDARVRHQVALVFTTPSTMQDAGGRLGDVGSTLLAAARTRSVDHAPLMIFIVAATVLVLFMVRS